MTIIKRFCVCSLNKEFSSGPTRSFIENIIYIQAGVVKTMVALTCINVGFNEVLKEWITRKTGPIELIVKYNESPWIFIYKTYSVRHLGMNLNVYLAYKHIIFAIQSISNNRCTYLSRLPYALCRAGLPPELWSGGIFKTVHILAILNFKIKLIKLWKIYQSKIPSI